MGIQVYETPESPVIVGGENPSVELRCKVEGTGDASVAMMTLLWFTPAIYNGLVRQTPKIEPDGDSPDVWAASVQYGPKKPPDTGDSTYQFDTGGGSQHITQSLKTLGKYAPPGKVAPDFKGAIGVTHDNVEGVDITVPVYNFSETHYIATELVTLAYKATLFSLTGKVNKHVFRGFAPGEVLFVGASGAKRGEKDWEITFRFAASPNVVGLTVGDIVGIAKPGWAYLWIRYADDEDNAAKVLVKKPIGAYVERVYEDGDFAGLGIGA
jgi:hypothetical protein